MGWSRHKAVVRAGGGLRTASVRTPDVGPGDVLVRMGHVGVCGTDLQILNGSRPDTARILGHEGTGTVEAVGRGGPAALAGRPVVFNPVNPADQSEVLGHSFDGLFQERVLVPARLVPTVLLGFEAGVPHAYGPLVEPLGTVVYGHELVRAACRPRRVAVIGAGAVGLLHAIYAREAGAEAVLLVSRQAERLAWAVEAGIVERDEAVLAAEDPSYGYCPTLGQREVADVAFVCTCRPRAPGAFELALSIVRDGGVIDLVGGFAGQDAWDRANRIDLNEVRRSNVCGRAAGPRRWSYKTKAGKRVWLTGHRGTSRRHLRKSMTALRAKPAAFGRVVTHVLPFARAATLVSKLASGRPRRIGNEECVKVVFDLTA